MRDEFFRQPLWWLATLVPTVGLFSLLTAPLPMTNVGGVREVAGYFQALALLRDGLVSYTYLTPAESYAALHLHSLLSTPFLAVGYTEGGRLVSLLAAITAVVALSAVAAELSSVRAVLFVPLFLWIDPLFVRFAGRWWPESLSIALTVLALLGVLKYVGSADDRWLLVGIVALMLGITNHMWEATILLPMCAVLVQQREWKATGIVSSVGIGTVVLVWFLTGLQPTSAGTLTHFGIHNQPSAIFAPELWNRISKWPIHPFPVAITLLFPTAVLAAVTTGRWAVRTADLRPTLLSTWLLSGLSIPLLLPLGADNHPYYFWAIVAPVTLFLVLQCERLLNADLGWDVQKEQVTTAVALFVLLGVGYVVVFEAGVLAGTGLPGVGNVYPASQAPMVDSDASADSVWAAVDDGQLKQAGRDLKETGVAQPNRVVFVGPWRGTSNQYQSAYPAARVLIYSDLLPKTRNTSATDGPRFISDNQLPVNCDVSIRISNRSVVVDQCE